VGGPARRGAISGEPVQSGRGPEPWGGSALRAPPRGVVAWPLSRSGGGGPPPQPEARAAACARGRGEAGAQEEEQERRSGGLARWRRGVRSRGEQGGGCVYCRVDSASTRSSVLAPASSLWSETRPAGRAPGRGGGGAGAASQQAHGAPRCRPCRPCRRCCCCCCRCCTGGGAGESVHLFVVPAAPPSPSAQRAQAAARVVAGGHGGGLRLLLCGGGSEWQGGAARGLLQAGQGGGEGRMHMRSPLFWGLPRTSGRTLEDAALRRAPRPRPRRGPGRRGLVGGRHAAWGRRRLLGTPLRPPRVPRSSRLQLRGPATVQPGQPLGPLAPGALAPLRRGAARGALLERLRLDQLWDPSSRVPVSHGWLLLLLAGGSPRRARGSAAGVEGGGGGAAGSPGPLDRAPSPQPLPRGPPAPAVAEVKALPHGRGGSVGREHGGLEQGRRPVGPRSTLGVEAHRDLACRGRWTGVGARAGMAAGMGAGPRGSQRGGGGSEAGRSAAAAGVPMVPRRGPPARVEAAAATPWRPAASDPEPRDPGTPLHRGPPQLVTQPLLPRRPARELSLRDSSTQAHPRGATRWAGGCCRCCCEARGGWGLRSC